MFIKLLLLTSILLGVSVLLLGIRIFFFKGKFPSSCTGNNKALIKKGIYCARKQDHLARYNHLNDMKLKIKL